MRKLLPLAALLFVGHPAIAKQGESALSFQAHGRVYTDQYLFTEGLRAGELEQSSLSSWLELNAELKDGPGLKLIPQFDVFYRDINNPYTETSKLTLREAYGHFQWSGGEIRVGQQIIPWGRSDGVNPTDYFTAKDFTRLNADDEVRRLGAPALNFSFTPDNGNSPFTFQLIAQAAFPQMKLLIPSQAVPTGISFQKYAPAPALFGKNAMEYGIKASYLKNDYDCSFSFYRGYSHYAEYIYQASTNSVVPIHPGETAVGGDGSFTWSSYVIRFESALHMPDNGTQTDPLFGLVEPWHWDSVLGAERPLGDDFRIQAQFLYRWHLYFPDDVSVNPVLLAIGRANSLILNYQQQGNPGATFRIGWQRDGSNWTADLFLLGYFGGGQNHLLRPQIGWTPIENLKLTAGMDWYGGDTSKPLGALHDRSHGFLEAKYVF
jgi:hypothetical protein